MTASSQENQPSADGRPAHEGPRSEPDGPPPANALTADAEAEKKRADKRPEPQTVAEFISAFYAGRLKSLSESTVRRLKSSGLQVDAATRGDLRRSALEIDETLDKSRRLMVVASEVPDLKALGHFLMEFASEVVVFHPRLRRNGLQARLFPTYHDDNDLGSAWEFLSETQGGGTGDRDLQSTSPPAIAEAAGAAESRDATKRKPPSEAALAGKVRRNALLCSVVWRVSRGAAFQEVMRGLRSSLFKLPAWPAALERELLEAVALMQDKEDGKVALLLEWQARQQAELAGKLEQISRGAQQLQDDVRTLERERDALTSANEDLRRAIEALQQNKEQLNARLGVVQTHGQADFEELRSMALRLVGDSTRKLEEVAAALSREQPKVIFAREILNGVVDTLTSGKKKLEDV